MKFVNAVVLCALLVAGAQNPAAADDIATSSIVQPGAPATITRCFVSYECGFRSAFNIYNRTSHSLIDASIEYRFYDRDNTQIGRTAYTYTQPRHSRRKTRVPSTTTMSTSASKSRSAQSRASAAGSQARTSPAGSHGNRGARGTGAASAPIRNRKRLAMMRRWPGCPRRPQ